MPRAASSVVTRSATAVPGIPLARGPNCAAASLGAQPRVQLLHAIEDDHGGRLRLLARGSLDPLEAQRLTELDRYLRKLQPLPVANAVGAGDGGRDHGHTGLEREAAEAVARGA